MTEILYRKECFDLVGAAMEVYNEIGSGFLEAIYQEALERELLLREIPFTREVGISIFYKGKPLKKHYLADFVAYEKIILELKAIAKITDTERSQVINYLKGTGFRLGILINFGNTKGLEWERLVL